MIDDKGRRQTATGQTAPSVLESREHLEAILQGVADGVIVQDAGGGIAYANEAAAQLLGAPSILSLLHHSIADVFAPPVTRFSARTSMGSSRAGTRPPNGSMATWPAK